MIELPCPALSARGEAPSPGGTKEGAWEARTPPRPPRKCLLPLVPELLPLVPAVAGLEPSVWDIELRSSLVVRFVKYSDFEAAQENEEVWV